MNIKLTNAEVEFAIENKLTTRSKIVNVLTRETKEELLKHNYLGFEYYVDSSFYALLRKRMDLLVKKTKTKKQKSDHQFD
jgi:hypothetical protein